MFGFECYGTRYYGDSGAVPYIPSIDFSYIDISISDIYNIKITVTGSGS